MEEIKTLYTKAKTSRNQKDIDSYIESIRETLDKNPLGYVTNLEYIITSNAGAKTFKEFVDKYGLSVALYDIVMESMNKCIHKCEVSKKDPTIYNEYVTWLENYKKEFKHCFTMFEFVSCDMNENYIQTYYGLNKSGIQNRKLITGMIDMFGEAAVPDIIITATSLGGSSVDTILEVFNSDDKSDDFLFNQVVFESCKDLTVGNPQLISSINDRSMDAMVKSMESRYNRKFQESVIMGDDSLIVEYTESEIETLNELISFKENMITCLEDESEMISLQKDIYSLYEKFGDLLLNDDEDLFDEDVANSVIPMLPGSQAKVSTVEESKWLTNTANKKNGNIPDYIKKNHNLNYGEEDNHNLNGKPSDDTEPTIEDYKRPSAIIPDDDSVLEPDTSKSSAFNDEPESVTDNKPLTSEEQKAINNYYYYTYTNSLNKNANSYNKHNTHTDDHSANKRIHSDNNNSENDEDSSLNESRQPWELDLGLFTDLIIESPSSENFNGTDNNSTGIISKNAVDEYYQEGIKDSLKKIAGRLKGFLTMRKTLANLQRMGSPAFINTNIPLMLPGSNIPIMINKSTSNNSHSESSIPDLPTVEKLFELDVIFTEDANNISNLSKNDIRNVINKLRSKFNAEIIFISNANKAVNELVGMGSVIETDRKTIEKMTSGKKVNKNNDLNMIPNKFQSDLSTLDRVILINPKFLADHKLISTPRELELIISHEYGHVLTFPTLTNRDWIEYSVKRQLINSICSELERNPPNGFDIIQSRAESNMAFYKLKPERIANEAVHLDPSELTYHAYKRKPTGKMEGLDLDGIVNWNIPDIVYQLSMQALQGKTEFTRNEIIQNIDVSVNLYNRVITDKYTLDTFLHSLKLMKEEQLLRPITEAVGDADDMKPESDHPIKDALSDIDRGLLKTQQKTKKVVQDTVNAGKAFVKPAVRTTQWIGNMVNQWKDVNETNIKERLADPQSRSSLLSAIKTAIKYGSLAKAGLLLNPIFLLLSLTRGFGKNKRMMRIRNEMIGEIKTEIEVIEEKIKDADRLGDNKAKYQLMRFKNEMKKKLIRVGGNKKIAKLI